MLASTVQICVGGKRTPLQMLVPGTANIKARYLARQSTTGTGSLLASGTAPIPAVGITSTFFGTSTVPCDVQITKEGVLGVAEFRISGNGGKTWLENQVTAAAYVFAQTGETITFAVGAYLTDHRYTRQIANEVSTIGSVSSTIAAGTLVPPIYQPNGMNGFGRCFFNGTDAGLGTSDAVMGNLINGTDKPFTLVIVGNICSISSVVASAQPMAGWARDNISSNPFLHVSVRGPAGAPANNFTSVREDDAGVAQTVNNGVPAPDREAHVWVIRSTGTTITVTQDGTQILNGAQNVGVMTINFFSIGGIKRFGLALAGLNIAINECVGYGADVGSLGATYLTNMYKMRNAIGSKAQVRRLICLAWLGQSNANGIIGTLMPAPPPGSPWTQIKMLRRVLAGIEAVSDSALQNLNFTTVAGGVYHGPGMQCAIDLWFSGYDVFLLNCSANGSYLTDWIGAGIYSAALDTAFANSITLLSSYYPNATPEWYWAWDQGEAEAKDASAVPATNWPANFGTYASGGPAAGTLLKKINDATGQTTRPRIFEQQTQLDVAPSSAPNLALMRANAIAVATGANGFSVNWDLLAIQTGYLMADNTHATGRCENFRGSLVSQNLLLNELAP